MYFTGGMEQLKCAHDDAVERIHEMEERQSEAKELYVGIQKKVDKQTGKQNNQSERVI